MKLAILAGVLMVLGLTGILVGTILRVNQHYIDERIDYGIVLDAGSTSTKAYIYQWSHKVDKFVPYVYLGKSSSHEAYTYQLYPGIATLAPNSTSIGNYLEPILSWAHALIPKDSVSSTPIYLQGTGGLRQLPDVTANAILTSVRYKLQDSGFHFENTYAAILSGLDEAGYGFLAVNALYDRFEAEESQPVFYGSLDLGGVSSEIAYQDSNPPMNNTFSFSVNTSDYSIYAQSNDGLGINSARFDFNYSLLLNTSGNIVLNPCVPFGYYENVTLNKAGMLQYFLLEGTSNANQCQQQVQQFVRSVTQSLHKPAIDSTTLFAVADHYFDLKKFYKLKDNANLLELEAKTNSFCGLNYGDALGQHHKFADTVQHYCFMGYYVVTLLEDFYGFDATSRHILWKEKIHHKSPATWTLGTMLQHVSQLPPDTSKQDRIRKIRFFHTSGGVVLLFASVLVFILGLVLFILQRRRPTDYVLIK